MPGIVSYGVYLPRHRLSRESIRKTLGQGGGKGTRSVAGYDEDTTSMAVEAARRARWNGSFEPASLQFATTAPAYADKTNANAIHAALELPAGVFATDHAGSVRSAVGALRADFSAPPTPASGSPTCSTGPRPARTSWSSRPPTAPTRSCCA
jgi:hydroxymethylglutaryl-CoA synthase